MRDKDNWVVAINTDKEQIMKVLPEGEYTRQIFVKAFEERAVQLDLERKIKELIKLFNICASSTYTQVTIINIPTKLVEQLSLLLTNARYETIEHLNKLTVRWYSDFEVECPEEIDWSDI